MRVEVCGGIASGKTTLALLMRRTGFAAALENFQANPFLKSFYSDPSRFAFETEVSFLLQHYSQIKAARSEHQVTICDYSFYLDLAYAHVTLKPLEKRAFDAVHKAVTRELGPPALLIHLHCSTDAEMKRIKRRHRPMERSITIDYLQMVNNSLDSCVERARKSINVLDIDSENLDFAHDLGIKDRVSELIVRAL